MMKNLCTNKKICMFGVSLLILTLIVAAILGLIAGPALSGKRVSPPGTVQPVADGDGCARHPHPRW